VTLRHHRADAGPADQLAHWLNDAGITVAGADQRGDSVVVFLSAAALAEPSWLGTGEFDGQVIPVRVGEIDADRAPAALRELN
jgi:hypothetical protein